MGIYKKGILGSFYGKVGTVIGSTWRGIDYMRSLPKVTAGRELTEPQLIVRAKFALATAFVSPVRPLFEAGYKSVKGKTGANAATAQIISDAIGGTYPALTLNYPQILISKGNLTGAVDADATGAAASVVVSWDNNAGSGNASADDKAMILVYSEDLSQYSYELDGELRSAGTQTIALAANFAGLEVQVWLAFVSANGKTVSTSVFAGVATVA